MVLSFVVRFLCMKYTLVHSLGRLLVRHRRTPLLLTRREVPRELLQAWFFGRHLVAGYRLRVKFSTAHQYHAVDERWLRKPVDAR